MATQQKTDGQGSEQKVAVVKADPNKVVQEIKTKVTKDGTAVKTNLTLDFTGVSREDLIGLATPTVTIREQATFRESGKIPSQHTVLVSEFLTRKREPFVATPESLANRAQAKLSVEDREKLVKKLQQDIAESKKQAAKGAKTAQATSK